MSIYNPSIPAATDFLSDSQVDIRNNFTQANDTMEINHFPFDDGTANNGKHKWSQIVKVASLASILPAPAANEGAVYTQTATSEGASNETNLYYTPDASANAYQLTRTVTGKFATFGLNTGNKGWTFLPGGLLLQYGRITTTSGGTSQNGTTTFPVAFTSIPFSVQVTVLETTNSRRFIKTSNLTTTSIGVWCQNENGGNEANQVYWVAIGK